MKIISKILLVLFIIIVAVAIYGAFFSIVYDKQTFLSEPIDCMPGSEIGGGWWGNFFGYRCGSY
jgi:flagellar basal body-associated protein FliL